MTIEVDRNYLAKLERVYEEYKRLAEPKKLTNYEKIKNMSIDEMVRFLNKATRTCGAICKREASCLEFNCEIGINKWLESEAENDK